MARLKVHSKMGRPFRRNGISWETSPRTIDTAKLGWTAAQVAAIKADAALHVEDLDGGGDSGTGDLKPPEPGTPEEAITAAVVAGESLPGADEPHPRGRRGR